MEFVKAKQTFIDTWGTLGSEWGINRTMAQIHALLLISPDALSTEDVMQALTISRGNANTNLRELLNWNLAKKSLQAGERKEFFSAEKNLWEVARRIAVERRKREIQPVLQVLKELQHIEKPKSAIEAREAQEFSSMMNQLHGFVEQVDDSLNLLLKSETMGVLLKIMKAFR